MPTNPPRKRTPKVHPIAAAIIAGIKPSLDSFERWASGLASLAEDMKETTDALAGTVTGSNKGIADIHAAMFPKNDKTIPAPKPALLGDLVTKPFTDFTRDDWERVASIGNLTGLDTMNTLGLIEGERVRIRRASEPKSELHLAGASSRSATGIGGDCDQAECLSVERLEASGSPAPTAGELRRNASTVKPMSEIDALVADIMGALEAGQRIRLHLQDKLAPVSHPGVPVAADGFPPRDKPKDGTPTLVAELRAVLARCQIANDRLVNVVEAVQL